MSSMPTCEDCLSEAIGLDHDGVFRCSACANGTGRAGPDVATVRDAVLAALSGTDAVRIRALVSSSEASTAAMDSVAATAAKASLAAEAVARDAISTLAETERILKAQVERIEKVGLDARRVVEFKRGDTVNVVDGYAHRHLPMLADLVANRQDAYLFGPSGAGKNTACEQVAKGFNLSFHCLQLSQLSLRSELIGFVSPIDRVPVETPFSLAYTNGGLFLADELDNWNASIVTAANSAIANGAYSFPWGRVARHPDFVWVGAGNTVGLGATTHFQERRSLSGATRSRMVTLEWGIDEELERALAGHHEWTSFVQACRRVAKANGDRILICPRCSIQGATLLNRGWARTDTVKAALLRGVECPSYLTAMVADFCVVF